jgi:hypothetical protein
VTIRKRHPEVPHAVVVAASAQRAGELKSTSRQKWV